MLLCIVVFFFGLILGQNHTPEQVVGGTVRGAVDVLGVLIRSVTRPEPSEPDGKSTKEDAVAIRKIQSGLVELGCLSKLGPNGEQNIDGVWGASTAEAFKQFAQDFLDDQGAAEAKLGAVGASGFYNNLLQEIEKYKGTGRRCTKNV